MQRLFQFTRNCLATKRTCNRCGTKIIPPKISWSRELFLYWSSHTRDLLNAKRVWCVVYTGDMMHSILVHLLCPNTVAEDGSPMVSDPEYAKVMPCSVIFQGSDEVPFACMMQDQEALKKRRSFLHEQYVA